MKDVEAFKIIDETQFENKIQRFSIVSILAFIIVAGILGMIIFGVHLIWVTIILVCIPIEVVVFIYISPFEKYKLLDILENDKTKIVWCFIIDRNVKLAPYFIPLITIRHEYPIVFALNDKRVYKLEMATKEQSMKLYEWLQTYLHEAIFGYTKELAYRYNSDPQNFLKLNQTESKLEERI